MPLSSNNKNSSVSEVIIAGEVVNNLGEIAEIMAKARPLPSGGGLEVDIDSIPLNIQPGVGEESLYTLASKASFVAACEFYQKTKHTAPICQLQKDLGEVQAQVLIEKAISLEFWDPTQAWIRRLYAQAIGRDDWNTPVVSSTHASAVLINVIWPSSEITLVSSSEFKSELVSRIKDISLTGLAWLTLWVQLGFSRIIGRKFTIGAAGLELAEGIDNDQRRSELPWNPKHDGTMRYVLFFTDLNYLTAKDSARLNSLDATSVILASSPRQLMRRFGRSVWSRLLEPPMQMRGIREQSVEGVLGFAVKRWLRAACWWTTVFQHYNIRAWVPIRESSLSSVIQWTAANRVGAMQLTRQRSEFNIFGEVLGYHPGDINLVWGNSGAAFFKNQRNKAHVIIRTGHFFGAGPKSYYAYTEELKQHMRDQNVSFTIAYFDGPAYNDFRISAEQARLAYERLLNWCLNHADVGLILKPKAIFSKTPSVEELCQHISVAPELMRRALETNRIIVVPYKKILPLAISRAANLTIGTLISSAALEANISGLQAVHYTPNPLADQILEKEAREVVVFDDIDNLMKAVQAVRDGNLEIGSAMRWIPEIDQFADGRGPERFRYILDIIVNRHIIDPMQIQHLVEQQFGNS